MCSLLCAYWVLEGLARSEGIQSSVYDHQENSEQEPILPDIQGSEEKMPIHQVTFRKFDFTRMFHIYFGLKGLIFSTSNIFLL